MILKKNAVRKFKKVLIINPFGIGDVLFTTPVIRAIKEEYPGCYIGYWSNARVKPLINSGFGVDKVFALSRGDIKKLYQESFFKGFWNSVKLILAIKKESFDICFDFSLDHRYGLFSKIIGISRRIGFNYKGRGRFLTDKIDIIGYNDKHAIEYYLDLLRLISIRLKDRNLALLVSAANLMKAKNILSLAYVEEGDLLVGIAPGAGGSWGKDAVYRHWPALKFAQVADELIDKFKVKIVLIGDEADAPIADVVINAMRNKAINLVGKVNLEVLPAIIKNFRIFISNDGGPMHMAVALGVNTVSVMGPASENVYGPYPMDENHVVLRWSGECRPCYKNFKLPVCDRDRECLRSVGVEDVFAAVVLLLENPK